MAAGAVGERLALVVGGGVVRIAVAIEIWEVRGDERRAFAGRILAKGDLAHDGFVGKPDPSGIPAGTRPGIGWARTYRLSTRHACAAAA
jgi:hypothetical protein